MPSVNVRAINYNCARCKLLPDHQFKPCDHKACQDHYMRQPVSRSSDEEYCPYCGKKADEVIELEKEPPVVSFIDPLDTTWHIDQPKDDDSAWPTPDMYGDTNGQTGHNFIHDANGFPKLERTIKSGTQSAANQSGSNSRNDGYQQSGTFAHANSGAFAHANNGYHANNYTASNNYAASNVGSSVYGGVPVFGGGYQASAYAPSNFGGSTYGGGYQQPGYMPSYGGGSTYGGAPYGGGSTYGGATGGSTYGGGYRPPQHFNAAPRGMNMSTPSTFGGYGGFNPNAPRYVPSSVGNNQQHSIDPIVRPESSISNHTFATQLPQMGDMAAPVPRRHYPQAFGNGMNSLGAGLDRLKLNNFNKQGPPSIIEEESEVGLDADTGALARRGDGSSNPSQFSRSHSHTPNSRYLAEEIMDGKTEDPQKHRKLPGYDIPAKLPAPMLGPARFIKDTKMFSTVGNAPGGDVNAIDTPLRQSLPPPPNPDWLDLATQGLMKPNLEEAFDSLPFTELPRTINPSTAGVIRISDIPYISSKPELIAFVGRQAQINRMPEGSPYHAVHIMMERESGKTQDCFIEFSTSNEAAWVVAQINKRVKGGRPPKIGDRTVKVAHSSQDELMAELFPRAKHVRWHNGQPIVDQSKRMYYEETAADGFSGFVHPEEFHAMKKHADLIDRAPFASKSPCRVYEMMITLLYKYPWYAVDLVSVRERRTMFDTAMALITSLCAALRESYNRPKPLDPTSGLLQELVAATLSCHGFSEKQKVYAADLVKKHGYTPMTHARSVNIRFGGVHPLAPHWPFSALSIHPNVNSKLVEYYASLFREATSSSSASLADRQAAKSTGYESGPPMGNFKVNYGNGHDNLTMAEVAKIEYKKIEQLLGFVCSRPGQQGKMPSAPNSIGPDYDTGRDSSGSSAAAAHSLF